MDRPPGEQVDMADEHPDLTYLRGQVDQACADVRRDESVGPALRLGVLVGSLPALLLLIDVLFRWMW